MSAAAGKRGSSAPDDEDAADQQQTFSQRMQAGVLRFVVMRPAWFQRAVFAIALYNIGIVPYRIGDNNRAPLVHALVDIVLDFLMLGDFLCNLTLPKPITQAEEQTAKFSAIAAIAVVAASASSSTPREVTDPCQAPGSPLVGPNTSPAPQGRQVGWHNARSNMQSVSQIFELCALMPLDIIGLAVNRGRLHPLWRLNKLVFRIHGTNVYFAAIEKELQVSQQLVSIVHITLWILVTVHLLGCLFLLVIRYDGEHADTWYWTQQPGLTEEAAINRYLVGFYWSLTMMTGYGSIIPQSDSQVIFSLVAVTLGVCGNVTVIGTLGSLVQNLDSSKTAFRQKMDSISEYMRYRRFSPEMAARVTEYYNYLWHSRRGLDEAKLIQELPHYLQEEVSLFINKEIISKVPLFHECDEQFKSAVVVKLIPVTLLPDSYIVRKGEVGREMYFISRGEVQVVSDAKQKKDRIVYATLRDGSFFGEVALLLNDSRRTATVVASQFSDLFMLRKEDFDLIRETFPHQSKTIAKAADKRYKLQRENEAEDE
eukprot:TRINITY_DN260_c1_g1_i1.p1 TRINITY_DN260_c1_g1~~TRINITY_DN260_c1_g1_i1.p1  ORF type:complete len:562 (+),score=197.78 TRINITY_DN260_c1_g1_i1:71-1687(+)